jgi:hypothetical protein
MRKIIIKFFILEMNKKMIKYHNDSVNFFLKKIGNLCIKRVLLGSCSDLFKKKFNKKSPQKASLLLAVNTADLILLPRRTSSTKIRIFFLEN